MAACRRPDRGSERGPSRTCTVRIGESCPARGAANQPFNRLPGPTAPRGWSSSKPRFKSRSCVNAGTSARLPVGVTRSEVAGSSPSRAEIGSPFDTRNGRPVISVNVALWRIPSK